MQLTTKQLAERLGVDAKRVRRWVAAGLPHFGQARLLRFDPEAVRTWLVAAGIAEAEAPRQLVGRVADVAAAFGVSERAVLYWRNQGMPVEPDGQFDLARIADWRASRIGRGDEALSSRVQYDTELARIRRDREALELERLRGAYIPIDEPTKVWERSVGLATAQLQQLADLAVAHAGKKATADERRKLREEMQAAVDKIQSSLAQAHQEWAQEIERMFEEQV